MIAMVEAKNTKKEMYYRISAEIRESLANGDIERCKSLGKDLKKVLHFA